MEHLACAPLLRELAQRGIACVLVELPLDLAVLAAEQIAEEMIGD